MRIYIPAALGSIQEMIVSEKEIHIVACDFRLIRLLESRAPASPHSLEVLQSIKKPGHLIGPQFIRAPRDDHGTPEPNLASLFFEQRLDAPNPDAPLRPTRRA